MKDTMILYLMLWRNKMREYIKRQKGQTVNGPAPARLKRSIVARCGQQFHCNVLIETGTYLGEMIEYQAKYFEKIYSIEISELFYNFSSKRLRKRKNIIVMQGDSSTVLEKVIRKLTVTDKVLFWLDGHYSGGKTGMGGGSVPYL